jgi:hypothetical protein
LGEFGASYLIEATTDLDAGAAAWSPVARVTNEFGVVPWRERFVTNRDPTILPDCAVGGTRTSE